MNRALLAITASVAALLTLAARPAPGRFDIVIAHAHGRVIDPDSGLDVEKRIPSMARRGRIGVGAYADVTGIRHVLVNGAAVVRDGEVAQRKMPGQPIRAGR